VSRAVWKVVANQSCGRVSRLALNLGPDEMRRDPEVPITSDKPALRYGSFPLRREILFAEQIRCKKSHGRAFTSTDVYKRPKENTMKCQNCPCGPNCECVICTCKHRS
jgi:hypothetical protein